MSTDKEVKAIVKAHDSRAMATISSVSTLEEVVEQWVYSETTTKEARRRSQLMLAQFHCDGCGTEIKKPTEIDGVLRPTRSMIIIRTGEVFCCKACMDSSFLSEYMFFLDNITYESDDEYPQDRDVRSQKRKRAFAKTTRFPSTQPTVAK